MNYNIERFDCMCGTTKTTLPNKTVNTQMQFCETVAIRSGLYGCETWVMTSSSKSSLQAAEMQFLKSVTGITR
jgi:formylmethanofuran:tetrahydromethanopterin formyltransferase